MINRHPLAMAIGLCCLLALLVRLIAYGLMPGPMHPDENFQYLDQAHRIAFGTGLIPWEYRIGIRSWLMPALLSPAFEIGKLLGGNPALALWIVATMLSIASLPSVACAMLWGYSAAGLAGAVAAGVANATWFEIAAFAPHALADTIAASLLIPGLYFSGVARPWPSPGARLIGALLLGLAFVLRLQLAPIVGITCLWCAWRGGHRQVLIGLAIPIVLSGSVDALTLSYPFQSIVRYAWVNLALGAAQSYGTLPWYAYAVMKLLFWGGLAVPVIGFALLGASRLPALALSALCVVLPFLLLAHKEDRFIYPALPLLFTLAGVGSAMAAKAILVRWRMENHAWLPGLSCAVLWPIMSLLALEQAPIWPYLHQFSAINAAVAEINRHPDVCGVALHPLEPWARVPGYSRFPAAVKIYGFTDTDPIARSAAFNYVIDHYGGAVLPKAGFSVLKCWDMPTRQSWPDRWIAHVCLWHRDGGCDPSASPTLSPPLPAFLGRENWAKADWK